MLFVAYGALGIPIVLWLVATRGLTHCRWFFCCGVFLAVGALLELIEEPLLVPGVIGYHEIVHVLVMGGLFFNWAYVHQLAVEGTQSTPLPVETDAAAVTV
jgi:hemolysin III